MIKINVYKFKEFRFFFVVDPVPWHNFWHQCFYCAACRTWRTWHHERPASVAREYVDLFVARSHQPCVTQLTNTANEQVHMAPINQPNLDHVCAVLKNNFFRNLNKNVYLFARTVFPFVCCWPCHWITFGWIGCRPSMRRMWPHTRSAFCPYRLHALWKWWPKHRFMWAKYFVLSS